MRTQPPRTWRWTAVVLRDSVLPLPVVATTLTLWRFEHGQFVGTVLAIRPDLYCGADVTDPAGTCTRNAPLSGSTGRPCSFVPVIGITRAFTRRAGECLVA